MADYNRILFPVDLAEVSPRLIRHVQELGRKFSAQVHVLYVAPELEYARVFYAPGPPAVRTYQTELVEAAENRLDALLNEKFGEYPELTARVARGEVRTEILKYIDENDISLVMMETKARRGLDRILFGSVAQGIIQLSPVPVITYNPLVDETAAEEMVGTRKILCPVDLSAVFSPELLEHAQTVGSKFSAELHLLYVVRSTTSYYGGDYIPSPQVEVAQAELQEEAKANLDEFAANYMGAYPALATAVASGHTARQILRYVKEHDISLVIMGTHGRRGLDKVVFGSVAQRVVQSATVPVMTLNPYQKEEK